MEIGEILGYVTAIIGSGGIVQLVNWRYNKRQKLAEVNSSELGNKASEIENMRKAMQDFYDPLLARQNVRIAELEEEVKGLREEKRNMEISHQKQIAKLQEQILEINRALGIRATKQIRNEKGQFIKAEEDEVEA